MQELYWALGSTIILMLISFFLPLGFTHKGKFFIIIAAFVLSLGGIAAVSTFPLWQISLLLVVLVFFTSYILEGRMGAFLYKEKHLITNVANEEAEEELAYEYEFENIKIENLIEIGEVKIPNHLSTENDAELLNNNQLEQEQSNTNLDKGHNSNYLLEDNDISFLIETNRELELEENVLGYLTDIESMLNEETEIQKEISQPSWLEELDKLSHVTQDLTIPIQKEADDPTAASTKVLIAIKEAAASKGKDENDLTEKLKK
jgi:hypothetical protein